MQCKLATWTTEAPDRRIDRLLRLITQPVWLQEAARITLASSGAKTAGVDGMTRQDLKPHLETVLQELRQELLSGSFRPAPARRTYIQKANGKLRPLGIHTLRDRIVQRAMLMAMDPIWESDFHHHSFGFRPSRSVHHAVRVVRMQLTDGPKARAGRWVIEGDLSSYFDTVHHRLLMKAIRKRICDKRFLDLMWLFLKAGHIDNGLFRAASEGVAQGGVISPLVSNIMLNEFDHHLERHHLCTKVRKHHHRWNDSIDNGLPIAIQQDRQRKPTFSYCRYADDFVITVRGTKKQAEQMREECRDFLEGTLKLTLNMDKTSITHVNDGFVFLGYRFVRKLGPHGKMRVVTNIPREKSRNFTASLTKLLSGNHHLSRVDVVEKINHKLDGWANFYQFANHKANVFHHVDRVVFWKLGHWLGCKYCTSLKSLMRRWYRRPSPSQAKSWHVKGKDSSGRYRDIYLVHLAGRGLKRANFPSVTINPYLLDGKRSITSSYDEVVMAFSRD